MLGAVVASEGGYDLAPADGGTRVTIFNVGRGLGKLITPLALSSARWDADAVANRIKTAVEAS